MEGQPVLNNYVNNARLYNMVLYFAFCSKYCIIGTATKALWRFLGIFREIAGLLNFRQV